MTDSVLSTFIERTHADPALARDLLDATDWNLEAAVTAYHSLYDTKTVEPEEYQYDPSEFIEIVASKQWIGNHALLFTLRLSVYSFSSFSSSLLFFLFFLFFSSFSSFSSLSFVFISSFSSFDPRKSPNIPPITLPTMLPNS